MNNDSVSILGIKVARLTMNEVMEWIEEKIMEEKPTHLVTANAEIIYNAYKKPEVADVVKNADLIIADGSGVVWASNKLKKPVPERVTGIDLVNKIFEYAEKKGWGIYFLGAKPEVVEKAVLDTLGRYNNLKVTGYLHGYFSQKDIEQVVENIAHTEPKIILVGLGAPKQENFIRENLEKMNVPVAIGVGGSFDVLAGVAKRAPKWMQELNLEWLYRFMKEPCRFRRIFALPMFVLAVLKQKYVLKG
ncbi:MAG: WecB/TagA/CpsF family glycosyltransferase [Clostridia bacterium]|nr:WecB/TagA/CpsF family glycosyltransferase [Clostridia bacterium]MDD4047886.1 WecB/TagA/CpsF family glycosyltransferase [Clostridia bacterium]